MKNRNRVQYVDRLRGLAVAAMFLVHSPWAWMSPEANSGAYARVISQISGMVAPVFMFLAGVSVAVIACRAPEGGKGRARARVALRGLEIMVIAYLLQTFFWACGGFGAPWTRVLKVDILNCIGASMILGAAVAWPTARFNWRALTGLLLLLFGAQILWRLPGVHSLPDGLAGYLVFIRKKSQFPLFPYGAWLFLGLLLGPLWYRIAVKEGRERPFWTGIASVAIVALVAGWALAALSLRPDWAAFGLSPDPIRTTVNHFFHKIGVLMMLFVGARLLSSPADRFPFPVLVLWGRTSLFAYCVHLVLIYYVGGPLFEKSLSRAGHLLAVLALAAVMFGLSALWERYGPPSVSSIILKKREDP